ncbi:Signal transduction histidine kinase [Arthrobacter sp. ov407]|uniref:sensor histidine kinase n=1 Tax=Arthrobacter sp. ov407 TaxID=1761748 RepID=UPI000885C055|nr:Signal transduction histidine kinase [Arthrobacter sp. ov407]
MLRQRLIRGADRHGEALGPRARVLVCQLPLAVMMAVVVLAAPAAWPGLPESTLCRFALVLQAALLAACVLVPWHRFGPLAPLLIPVLDLIAIGLLRDGTSAGLPDPGVLSVLPVVWISASSLSAPASLSLSFSVPLLASLPWLLADRAAPLAASTAEAVLVPLMMLAVSLAMHFTRTRLRHEQRRIKSKEAELEVLLADSREREQLLNTILDTVDVGIVAVDAAGRRLLTNSWQTQLEESAATAPRPAGQLPAAELLEEEGQLLLTGQDRSTPLPLERRPIRRALAGESFADYLVCFGEAAAGRVVSTGARPLKDDAGDFRGAVVIFNEVTGLVDALAAKDEVVSTVSHEFRTPLTSIIGNLDLVLADTEGLDSPVVRRVEVAQRNAERLLALVSDLLMSASAAVHVHPRRTDLAGLVEASLGSAQAHAQASRVCLAMDVRGPLWAHVDPLRISQALDNLVSNAIKYSPDGGSVRVSASTGDGLVRLHVEDTGMGMTAADAGRVFTRFFRSPAVRDGSIPGAGLGLSITKAIVERHGGSISCRTRPGHGSTFTLELPADGPPAAF